ncbi:MAG: DMT family transporter [Acidovorax sp.]|jgi:drug/metabolite transporter (DMT)-like permease|nr:DMT family transporter [Acidovorax sp.]
MVTRQLWSGSLFATTAGVLWGLVFVVPLLLPDYPPLLLTLGRYLCFGLVALPLAWVDRAALRQLRRPAWLLALRLTLVGNLAFYLLMTSAIQHAGAPLPTLIASGALPVVIAIASNLRAGPQAMAWQRLFPSLGLMLAGMALVNHHELQALGQVNAGTDLADYGLGILMALCALMCWTWFPIRNAEWLRSQPQIAPRTWATAQGLITLPIAALGYLLLWATAPEGHDSFAMPLGPQPAMFVLLMVAAGVLGSWLGAMCWNAACQRMPTSLSSQFIVCETLTALAYAYTLRGNWPPAPTLMGIALLVGGVLWALRNAQPVGQAAPHPNPLPGGARE